MTNIFTAVISRDRPYWTHVNAFNKAAGYAAQFGIRTFCYNHVGDSLLCRARNECLYKFLNESDADYFFTIDDDVAIPPDALTMLIDADKDMVGGMYLLKQDASDTGLWLSGRTVEEVDIEAYARQPIEKDQLIPAEYISTGCVLHKRSFLERLWKKWEGTDIEYDNVSVFFTNEQKKNCKRVGVYQPFVYNREYLSEDWAMCRRAHMVGEQDLWLHAGVRCEHYGMKAYAFPSEWNESKVLP